MYTFIFVTAVLLSLDIIGKVYALTTRKVERTVNQIGFDVVVNVSWFAWAVWVLGAHAS